MWFIREFAKNSIPDNGRGFFLLVDIRSYPSKLIHEVGDGYFEDTQAINRRTTEINGGCFFKVFGGTGNLSDVKTLVDNLGEHLVVEDEVI